MDGLWKEAKTAEGRVYYYHTVSKKTQWEKPEGYGAQHPQEQIDAAWREARADNGRPYFYNTLTNETKWEAPQGLLRQQQVAPRESFVAGGGIRRADREHSLLQRPRFEGSVGSMPWEGRSESLGFRGPAAVHNDEPQFASEAEAEEAFFKLLKRHNITSSVAWEEAMRKVASEREFRSIHRAGLRKKAFDKYQVQTRALEKEKEKERLEKLREDFKRKLTTRDDIKYYTRWMTAKPLIEQEAVYKQAGNDAENIFEEYIQDLCKQHKEQEDADRLAALTGLKEMLATMITDPNTPWPTAKEMILSSAWWKTESRAKELSMEDLLYSFENQTRLMDHARNEAKQRKNAQAKRDDRKARDGFTELLEELRQGGKIKSGVTWRQILSLLENDPRYDNALGRPGSTPLQLFFDVVEREERQLRSKRNDALDVLEALEYEMTPDTTLEQFVDVMMKDERTNNFSREDYSLIFQRLQEKIMKRLEQDRKRAERDQHRAIDALRSVIRRLEPPIRGSDKYEDVVPRIQDYEEFQMLDDDEARRTAFEKQVRRVQAKEEDDRRRREDRNRTRESRNGDRDRRHRTSRTPEADAYEADRRKAQADRERHYRGASSFGLSPPPAERRRDDRYDRDSRRYDRPESIYDRDRRERDLERERERSSYIPRADPRDKGRLLDYGDDDAVGSVSRSGSVRKRRESDDVSHLVSKRPRREPTPQQAQREKDEPALQSGSEEGEIEEV